MLRTVVNAPMAAFAVFPAALPLSSVAPRRRPRSAERPAAARRQPQVEQVNLHGPGLNYPVSGCTPRPASRWRSFRFDNWRRVRDADGAEGWINQSRVGAAPRLPPVAAARKRRSCCAPTATPMRASSRLEPGVIGTIRNATASGAMEVAGHRGWISQTQIWGAYPGSLQGLIAARIGKSKRRSGYPSAPLLSQETQKAVRTTSAAASPRCRHWRSPSLPAAPAGCGPSPRRCRCPLPGSRLR